MFQPRPSSPQEDILTEEPLFHLARKTKRWKAAALDFFLVFVISIVLARILGRQTIDDAGVISFELTGLPGLLGVMVPWFILLPLMESITKGQTLGKWAYRIRTAKADGRRIDGTEAIARHLFDFIDILPFFGIVGLLVASNNRRQQRVGDLVAKTIVIDA